MTLKKRGKFYSGTADKIRKERFLQLRIFTHAIKSLRVPPLQPITSNSAKIFSCFSCLVERCSTVQKADSRGKITFIWGISCRAGKFTEFADTNLQTRKTAHRHI